MTVVTGQRLVEVEREPLVMERKRSALQAANDSIDFHSPRGSIGCLILPGVRSLRSFDAQLRNRGSKITHRVIAVDEEQGVVAMRMNFGPGSVFQGAGELDVWHSSKIFGGQIHAEEAYYEIVPAGTKSGWE